MTMLLALAALAAASPADSFTLREARALPPGGLATRLMGPLGRLYPEARASTDVAGTGLEAVELASVPGVAADGLCMADRVSIHFQPVPAAGANEEPASRIDEARFDHGYRLVGEAEGFTPGSEARNEAVLAGCRAAGDVLDHGGPHYFYSEQGFAEISMIARAFTLVRAAARRGPIANLSCAENANAPDERICAHPRAVVAGLDRGAIDSAAIAPCGTDTRRLCAELVFSRPETRPGIVRSIVLTIRIDGTPGNPIPDRIGIRSVRLALVTEGDM